MQNGTCPRCTNATVYKGTLTTKGGLLVFINKPGLFNGGTFFNVDCYLCANCGHIELCAETTSVDGENLRQQFEQGNGTNWQRVAPR